MAEPGSDPVGSTGRVFRTLTSSMNCVVEVEQIPVRYGATAPLVPPILVGLQVTSERTAVHIQAGGSVSVAMTQGIEGGQGAGSGSIQSKGDLSLTTAKLIGGTGAGSGRVESLDGLLNSVFIDGQMWGGAGEGSGVLASKAGIGNNHHQRCAGWWLRCQQRSNSDNGKRCFCDIRGAVLGGEQDSPRESSPAAR